MKTINNDRSSLKNDHLYFLKHAERSCVGTHACEKRFVLITVQLSKYFTSKLNKYHVFNSNLQLTSERKQ